MVFYFFKKNINQDQATNNKYNYIKQNLRTYSDSLHNTHTISKKRTATKNRIPSFITSSRKASITIEASLVMPLFLIAMLFLLSMIEIIRLQSEFEQSLHQYGKKMAVHAYAYDKIQKNDSSVVDVVESLSFSTGFLKKEIEDSLGKEYLNDSPLVNGDAGILYLYSSFMKDDIIDLVIQYEVQPFGNLFGTKRMKLMNRCRLHAWTGYDLKSVSNSWKEKEQYVYIAEDGEVYHTNRNCTHLVLSIQECSIDTLDNFRNEDGGKYSSCELCGTSQLEGRIRYITETGNRYHIDKNCSGLKRTVSVIPLSQVNQKRGCIRCSKLVG